MLQGDPSVYWSLCQGIGPWGAKNTLTSDERTARIVLSGSLDVYSKSHVESLLPDPESVDRVIIDCSSVSIIESAVLTVLMRYRRRFQDAGRDPVEIIIVVNPSVRRIFDITGLNRVLTIVSAADKPPEKV